MAIQRLPIKSIECNTVDTETQKGKFLFLRREGSTGGDYFKILRTIGEGGSCVCYDATLIGEKKTGRLKEFYPLSGVNGNGSFVLERSARNHLVATEQTRDTFLSARREFTESYRLLRDVMQENENNADFTSFIPDFSIYYACDEQGNLIDGSTAYIWTAPESLTVFEQYLRDVHKHPCAYPEHKLLTILKTTITLAECIRILHGKGLLHLDIKPSNFGIHQRKGMLLTDSISLFDINSFYSLDSTLPADCGTDGFRAPEVERGIADNTSDIYSIGCTLFSALMVSEEIDTVGYSRKYYKDIPRLLEVSTLISASEANSNVYLRYELSNILKKCLAESPRKRYQSCIDLIRDLNNAAAYLYPAELNANLPESKQLVILEKELDKKQGVGSYITFMYHLYKKPLFEFIPHDSETVDILIVGFGNYGQRFLDCCLQTGQVLDKRLNVKVVSNDRAEGKRDKDLYLAARPALTDFFSIDGSACDDAYGSIVFENREFIKGDLKSNKKIAAEIVNHHNREKYIFIALGNDELNKGVAQAIVATVGGNRKCSVNFAYDGDHIADQVYGNPVYMSDDITKEALFRDLERMAFNAHLIWESAPTGDLAKTRAKFKEPYNYNASFANVISIKYKFYRFQIDMEDLNEAASQYDQKITRSDHEFKNKMVALEHRRWVCEKICEGWNCNRNIETCLNGVPNDKKTKKHICLVKSTENTPLQTGDWPISRWDKATDADLATLDELDRVSVRLHRLYKSAADRLKKGYPLMDSSMLQLSSIMKKDIKASIAFSEWYSCLSLLWNGNESPVSEYEILKKALVDSLILLSKDDAELAKTLIKLIDNRFNIILKSMRYTDYKKHDADFVNYIPFILTHKLNTHMVIPFSCGSNTEMFANVAAATVASPSQITYLYHFNSTREIGDFENAIHYVFNYMNEKMMALKLNFIISYRKDNGLCAAVDRLKELLSGTAGVLKIQKFLAFPIENDSQIASTFFKQLDTKFSFDATIQNQTPLSYLLTGAGFYTKYPTCQFDMNTRKFHSVSGCDFLRFIKSSQHLKVSDMFASKNSKGYLESPAAFHNDYEALWQKAYRNQETIWKKLCVVLGDFHKIEDCLISINTDVTKETDCFVGFRFLIPASAYEGARKIISFMTDAGVFANSSEAHYYTTDSCEVNITASRSIESEVRSLLTNPYILNQPDSIMLAQNPYEITVSFDCLTVNGLDLGIFGKYADTVRDLLKLLETEFAFIMGYKEDGTNTNLVSFTYATKRIKKLMTHAGKILEVYIYHKCLNSGLFDDIATRYEISWDGTAVKSAFDIVLTKGFAGLLIEAKATEEITQDYYFKLSCLAKQFGTNCKAVLIADTVEKSESKNVGNDMQRLRGSMLDVITVSDPEAIDAIDQTLYRLLCDESTAKVDSPSAPPIMSAEPNRSSREAFLAQKISVLKISRNLLSLLQSHNVLTVSDFLEQTEESFSAIKDQAGTSFTAQLLRVQALMKSRLESL